MACAPGGGRRWYPLVTRMEEAARTKGSRVREVGEDKAEKDEKLEDDDGAEM